MRVIINGRRNFGRRALEELSVAGEEVVGVICPPTDGENGDNGDELEAAARQRDIPILYVDDFRSETVRADIAAWSPDLCVMAYVTAFVPRAILEQPKLGTIQYHPSLLPRHRGPSAINWAIIQGEARTGVTIFWPDEGLDTGPILLQEEVAIDAVDSAGSLYYDKLFPVGVSALVKSVALVREGAAPRIQQDERIASYEGWCGQEHVRINWCAATQEVHNLIRGADPSPGAWTRRNGRTLRLYSSTPAANESRNMVETRRPGTITAIADESVEIATGDGAVVIARVRDDDGRKLPAGTYARQQGLGPGDGLSD